jgi:putative acetyltransferase
MHIRRDDPRRPAVRELLEEHLRDMYSITPAGSVHALDVDALCVPAITFWTARDGEQVLGCGALKELDPTHGEVKSMRTAAAHRRRGVGRAILEHIVAEARARSYARLSLETGAAAPFTPAHRLYEGFGFTYCGPFGDYVADPNSIFLRLEL